MRKKRIANNILIGIIIFLTIILSPAQITSLEKIFISDIKYPSVFNLTEKDKEWIETKLDEMTLYEKCAQMIMPPVYRDDLDPSSEGYEKIASLVKDEKIGGLILYQGELVEQARFITEMQKLADVPLLIASDFERGLGSRIDDATEFPHVMALGSTHNSNYAYKMGKAIAIESRILGVHQNFAPVADINNNPLNPIINIRSFSEDKNEVAEFVNAFINGSKEERVITTAKHFPGHGNTEVDSHYDLPRINGNKNYLMNNELLPFVKAIENGVQSIMTGHLEVPSLEVKKGLPATLSKSIITDLLKGDLQFDGLIITDAMIMEAITKYFSVEEATVMAVDAGNDIILMPPDEQRAIDAIYNAVISDNLSEERINESVIKILSAKRWLQIGVNQITDINVITDSIKIKEHQQLSKTIAENSITLLKNEKQLLPFNPDKYENIYCIAVTDEYWKENAKHFQDLVVNRLGTVTSSILTNKSKKYEYKSILSDLENSDFIILPTFLEYDTGEGFMKLLPEQTKFISDILKLNIPTILLSFRNPYLLYFFPEVTTCLNSYSHSEPSQKAMLRAILGEINIVGKLPITIPESNLVYGNGIEQRKTVNTKIEVVTISNVRLNKIDGKINAVLKENLFPGVVVCIGSKDKILYHNAVNNSGFGNYSYKLKKADIFNIGSLTGFAATTQAIMMLVDNGKIRLDEPAYYYLPQLNDEEKRKITIEHLVLYTSGFAGNLNQLNPAWNKEELVNNFLKEELVHSPGIEQNFSILNLIALQKIIETVSGKKMDEFITANFYSSIGMKNTMFHMHSDSLNLLLYSSDEKNSFYTSVKTRSDAMLEILGGVSGFSGLYSTTYDLAIFSQMLLQKGYYDDTQYLKAKTVIDWLTLEKRKIQRGMLTQPYTSMNSEYNYIPEKGFMFIDPDGSAIMIDME
ncbi:MAG: hypothetical protein DRQ13_04880, partial [Ignavibacteriae bacterium]